MTILQTPVRAVSTAMERMLGSHTPWQRGAESLSNVGAVARPVVIQGGWGTNAEMYEPLRRFLDNLDFDVTVSQTRGQGIATLQDDARQLAKAVSHASRRSIQGGGDGVVDILAHSKGGLSARLYLQGDVHDGVQRVGQLVTLGTPHNGVQPFRPGLTNLIAGMPGNNAMRQMTRDSAIVKQLNDDLPAFMERAVDVQPGFRMVSLAGDLDKPGLRGSDGMVSVGAARLREDAPGVFNHVFRGSNAHHWNISGQVGMHDPTVRSAALVLAGYAPGDAVSGALDGTRLLRLVSSADQ